VRDGTPNAPFAWRELFVAMLIVAVGAGTMSHASRQHAAEKKAHALKAKLTTIHQKKQVVQKQIRAAKVRKRTWTEQLKDTQQQLRASRNRVAVSEARLARTQRELNATRRDLNGTRARLKTRNNLLARRLVATQRRGTVNYAAVIFDANDYWDFLSRRRLMSNLVRYDVRLVNAIRADEKDALRLQGELTAKQAEQKDLVASLDRQRIIREGLRQQQADEVKQAAREQANAEQELAALEKASNEVANFLRRLVATPEGRARAAIPYHGGFAFPVGGRVTSPFGMRFHPVLHRYKLHTGIDFGVGTGTPIHAAGNGVVVHAGWWGAYGNAVIVDHGGGITTLYGHMSRVLCSRGQSVGRGTVLGLVGSTGWSTGPHCHFEVRKNGVPVNPMSYH
jgi:murein DD-endopeptidase MepM/ murein hydrolase activator NlpD